MHLYTTGQWVLLFFFYCFCGWGWESCYVSIRQRRWIEWRKPERVHPERLQIVETIDHALEITVAVSIGIAE